MPAKTKAERRETKKKKRPQGQNDNGPQSTDKSGYKGKAIEINPRNPKQADLIDALYDAGRDVVVAEGPAGTGKTLLATLYAIREFKDGSFKKIVITRPTVASGEDLGFLPGSLIEKMAPWVAPVTDVFKEVMSPMELEKLLVDGKLEIAPLAFMRGRTFKNTIIIADEMQNATPEQMKMMLTRIGDNSQMVVTGDTRQHDRGEGGVTGLGDLVERLQHRPSQRFAHVSFNKHEVERHPVIEDVLDMYDE